MKIYTITALSISLAIAGLHAQDYRAQNEDAKVQSPRHVTLDALIGAEVCLVPSAEARREAAEEGESPDRPKGEIVDLIIGGKDCSMQYAVVSVGGLLGIGAKNVLLSNDVLRDAKVEDGEPTFTLAMTESELKACPAFDCDEAKKRGLDVAVKMDQAQKSDKGKDRTGANVAEASTRNNNKTVSNLILASQLAGCSVRTPSEEFGSVDSCYVNCSTRAAEYLVVSHGGVAGIGDTLYLVPIKACTMIEYDDEPALQLNKSTKDLEAAPEFKKSDNESVPVNEATAKLAREFYGVNESNADRKKDRK